jgi:hypothetical protein
MFKRFVHLNQIEDEFIKRFYNFKKEIEDEFIMCMGGIGDALIGFAEAKAKNVTIVFLATIKNYKKIIENLAKTLGIKAVVFQGDIKIYKSFYNFYKNKLNCVSTTYLPDNCNHSYWFDKKYENRITTTLDVQSIGKKENGATIIAPCGSSPITKLGSLKKVRKIEANEMLRMINTIEGNIFIVGKLEQLNYDISKHPNVKKLCFEGILDHENNFHKHELTDCLKIINGAKLMLSVDTWAKTYGHYAGIPTIVFKTKYSGKYYPLGSIDAGDNIFLNTNIWNFSVKTIEEYINITSLTHI